MERARKRWILKLSVTFPLWCPFVILGVALTAAGVIGALAALPGGLYLTLAFTDMSFEALCALFPLTFPLVWIVAAALFLPAVGLIYAGIGAMSAPFWFMDYLDERRRKC